MAAKDRMKKRRERILKKGGKTLSVLIEQDTVVKLKHLKSHFQESQAALVARAINNLYETFQVDVLKNTPEENLPENALINEHIREEKDAKPNSDELLMKLILGQ